MFPRSEDAEAWEHISEAWRERAACRLMVGLLDLADRANVMAELAVELGRLLESAELPDIDVLRDRFAPRPAQMPQVVVVLPSTSVYDELLGPHECRRHCIGRSGAADAHVAAPADHQALVGRGRRAVQPRELRRAR